MFEFEVSETPSLLPAVSSKFDKMVMVITPDCDLRNILLYTLDSYGCRTIFSSNGAEALHSTAIAAFDYIVVDSGTDSPDSFDLLRCLRERFPLAIIIALHEEDRGVALLEEGANDFLQKPLVPYRLAMMISGEDILA